MNKTKIVHALRNAIQDAEEFGLVRTESGQVVTGATLQDDGITLTEGAPVNERKKAGHLSHVSVYGGLGSCGVSGLLAKDTRGTHASGGSRDFSGHPITTSWLERLEYVEKADTTVIYTRNSIYFTTGNIVEKYFGEGMSHVEGKEDIGARFATHQSMSNRIVYQLTQSGHDMTGDPLGAHIEVNNNFVDHPLCGPAETPFSLKADYGTTDINKVVFLTSNMFKEVL